MFDHLHVQHHVELFTRFGQRLGGGVAVVDLEPRLLRMDLRDRDVACCGIGINSFSSRKAKQEQRHKKTVEYVLRHPYLEKNISLFCGSLAS